MRSTLAAISSSNVGAGPALPAPAERPQAVDRVTTATTATAASTRRKIFIGASGLLRERPAQSEGAAAISLDARARSAVCSLRSLHRRPAAARREARGGKGKAPAAT